MSLMVFNKKGEFRYLFPQNIFYPSPDQESRLEKEGILSKPLGLFIKNNRIYVTDVADHTVKVFTPTGKLIKTIGKPGIGKGEFTYPVSVLVANDNIYIADANNSRVEVFDMKGKFLTFLKPPREKIFSLPRGLAADRLGRIYVVDTANNRVIVFYRNRYLFSLGDESVEKGGNFLFPNGIAIDKETGLIFIVDGGNNRLSVWGNE